MLFRSLKVVVSKSHEISFQVSTWFSAAIIAFLFLYLLSCDETIVYSPGYDCGDNDSIGVWKFLGLENERVCAITVHPQKPNIIFVGTSKDFSAGIPGRLYRSIDCGKTWKVLFEGVGDAQSVNQILFDPDNPKIIYAIPHPVLKSTDGGNSWKDASDGIRLDWETSVQSIVIDPLDHSVLYAGTSGFFGGSLYKSTNSGKSWKDLYRTEEETPGLHDGVISLAIDPINNNVIYAGTAWRGLIIKSVDAGYGWTIVNEAHQLINNLIIDYNSTQSVYAAVSYDGFSRSLDGGDSWLSFNEGLGDTVYGERININPLNSDLFSIAYYLDGMGNYLTGGVYTLNQNDQIWKNISLINLIFYSLFITEDGRYLYCGTNGGLYKIKLE